MSASRYPSHQKFDLSIESSDILRLIQAHLAEQGLVASLEALQNESGVKSAGSVNKNWQQWASRGEWGMILQHLAKLDLSRGGNSNMSNLMSEVYEMSILELGEKGELAVAYATLRLVAHSLDQIDDNTKQASNLVRNSNELVSEKGIPKSRQLEQKLAALAALRKNKSGSKEEALLPPNYYSRPNKQTLREELGQKLMESIPQVPSSRLSCLLQQAVQWQAHTGQLPLITQYYNAEDGDSQSSSSKPRKKKVRKKRKFDLVLGQTSMVDDNDDEDTVIHESVIRKVYAQVSFGKKAAPQVAIFHPDDGSLITGSSDGLIEIWNPSSRYQELRMDLSYQQNEELLGHDDNVKVTALALSPDGNLLATGDANGLVKVWKILGDGACLREFQAHLQAWISCLQFNPNASVLLTASHDTTCREYGLRSQGRLLKEFRGHSSFVTQCAYHLSNDSHDDDADENDWSLKVITASADGTVRLWDAATSELLYMFRPPSTLSTKIGSSLSMPISGSSSTIVDTLEIHSMFLRPKNQLLFVPRSSSAYLIDLSSPSPGRVLQTYSIASPKKTEAESVVMVAAACSSHWFYAVTNQGSLHVFDIVTGNEETTRASFCSDCGLDEEVSSMVIHPHQTLLAVFSSQLSTTNKKKKNLLTLWK